MLELQNNLILSTLLMDVMMMLTLNLQPFNYILRFLCPQMQGEHIPESPNSNTFQRNMTQTLDYMAFGHFTPVYSKETPVSKVFC